MSALMHPKIFILNLSSKSWYNNDFFRCYIASFMVLISGLMLLNVALFTEKRFQVISTHFNLIKFHMLANITTALFDLALMKSYPLQLKQTFINSCVEP